MATSVAYLLITAAKFRNIGERSEPSPGYRRSRRLPNPVTAAAINLCHLFTPRYSLSNQSAAAVQLRRVNLKVLEGLPPPADRGVNDFKLGC
ncbi:hypothetical protein Zmor_027666 [Zophobas morio]|uniref:Uncharacterized protein n=1 Tax=Zophobas morio TaxID=2755281 RepID=A0AA38HPR1_9CUCU|nr:hypothetical protein Zmor_027666 [Zophobas morio]